MTVKFDPKAEYILQDERALLRPLLEKDLDHLLPFALNEADTWKYSHGNGAGKDGMANYIQNALMARKQGTEYPFIIFDK